jgi:hypothetical protein
MRSPWANISLLFLLAVQIATGYWGMVNGRGAFRWVLWLHGIGAYSLLVLFYWKSDIILNSWRRRKRWTLRRLVFALTILLLMLTLILGLLWSFQGPIYLFGFSLVSLHIYLAIPLMVLMLWHGWQMRFVARLPETFSRRLFLNAVISSAAGLLLWRTARAARKMLALPGQKRRFTGSYEVGSDTGRFPIVSWIADDPEPIRLEQWRLQIDGAVQRPLSLSYEQLSGLTADSRQATLDCTGGWYTTQTWEGVELGRLLEMAGLEESAASVTLRAVSGYQRRFRVADAADFLLALRVAGQPLTHGHGAPVRLVAVEKRGLEWVKWVSDIRVNGSSHLWQLPLPLR